MSGLGMAYAIGGAAIAVILPGIGSALGIRYAASAGAGVMSEDPRNFGKYLILVTLPGTQGVYGFIVGFLVLSKLHVLSLEITAIQGLQIMLACLPIAFAGLISAIQQGRVCAAGVNMTAKQPDQVGKAMVFGVFVEFYAILGLIITIFFLNLIK